MDTYANIIRQLHQSLKERKKISIRPHCPETLLASSDGGKVLRVAVEWKARNDQVLGALALTFFANAMTLQQAAERYVPRLMAIVAR